MCLKVTTLRRWTPARPKARWASWLDLVTFHRSRATLGALDNILGKLRRNSNMRFAMIYHTGKKWPEFTPSSCMCFFYGKEGIIRTGGILPQIETRDKDKTRNGQRHGFCPFPPLYFSLFSPPHFPMNRREYVSGESEKLSKMGWKHIT